MTDFPKPTTVRLGTDDQPKLSNTTAEALIKFEELCAKYANDPEETALVAVMQYVLNNRNDPRVLGIIEEIMGSAGYSMIDIVRSDHPSELLTLLQEQIDATERTETMVVNARQRLRKLL